MLSLLIALALWGGTFYGMEFHVWAGHPVWNTVFGFIAFLAAWIIISLQVNKRLMKIFRDVQEHLMAAQERIRREIMTLQQKGMGGPILQARIEEKLKANVVEAIGMLDAVKPLNKWNLLAERQANTMKSQLYFQIKDYENADKYLDKALAFDPMILAMQMVRHYKHGDTKKLQKAYEFGIRRFKGEKGVIIYALYSWILVKEEKIEEAVVVLDAARTKTDNETLKQNWEHLANGRIKKFSNANLGELWYALNLEEPKQIRMRQQQQQYYR